MSDADLHPKMQISVEIPLQVESSDTIDSVKAKIMDQVGIPAGQILLVYGGNSLEDGSTLADSNIQQGSTLQLGMRAHPKMQISVECIDGSTILLEVESSDTIDSVKAKIMDKEGTSADKIELVYDGKTLVNGFTLADFNIQQGSTLQFRLRVRGGGQELGNIGGTWSGEESEKKNKKKEHEAKAEPGSSETKKPEENKKKAEPGSSETKKPEENKKKPEKNKKKKNSKWQRG